MARSIEEIESDAIHALNENDPELMRQVAAELEETGRELDAAAVLSRACELEDCGE